MRWAGNAHKKKECRRWWWQPEDTGSVRCPPRSVDQCRGSSVQSPPPSYCYSRLDVPLCVTVDCGADERGAGAGGGGGRTIGRTGAVRGEAAPYRVVVMAEVAGTGLLPSRAALHRRRRRPAPSPQAPLGLAMALGIRRTPTVSQRRHRRLTSATLSDDTTASPTPLPLASSTTINTPRLLLLLHTPSSVCPTVCRLPGTTPM